MIDLEPFKQEIEPSANNLCVNLNDDAHQNRISWIKSGIEYGTPDKGDLEEDSHRILWQFYMQKEGRQYLNKDGIVACKRREEDKVQNKCNATLLPQLYQTDLLFRSQD